MSSDRRHALAERIRTFLKQGDPAGDGAALSGSDLARMRRAILAEAGARPRSASSRLALAAVAGAALLVAVVWLARIGLGEREAAGVAVLPIPPAATESTSPPESPMPRAAQPAPQATRVEPARVVAAQPTADPSANPAGAAALPPSPRTIRFVTSSGTQIVWTLDPELEI